VNIGLPCGASYWQVGDSSEQNGSFKMNLTKSKKGIVAKKNDAELVFKPDKRDVAKLVKYLWQSQFLALK
jgi:hypothetical protein